ncbi:MAG: hypothetical protein V2A65_09100 [Candidatus Omnitrophota bacterium]
MAQEKRAEKIVSFEESLKERMGKQWEKVSKEDKKVIHEMSACQMKGGPIGSAVVENEWE